MPACVVRTIDLAYTYPTGVNALVGVDFSAGVGEMVVVLGASGSGKTTLLRHFNASLRATSGQVLIDGRNLADDYGDWVYRAVGFVFQDPNDQLFAATVGEDVAFGPRNMGLSPEDIASLVTKYLDWAGLAGWEQRPISTLSFGQKRRVAIAGVLAMSPKVIVLDEPTSGLDPQVAGTIMSLLQSLCRLHGITVIIATHDVDLVPAYANRVYILENGQVASSGPTPEVFSDAEILYRCGLRTPRAAHTLHLISEELGRPFLDLPVTMDRPLIFGEYRTSWSGSENPGRTAQHGFTTGAAAAAAARAAAECLLTGRIVAQVELRTSLGVCLSVPVAGVSRAGEDTATARVIKDGGENRETDPIHGAAIEATVRAVDGPGICIKGGEGVGRVTEPGLPAPPGEAAINPVPKQMIADAVGDLLRPGQGLEVVVSVPGGEAIAAGTLNSRCGIEGGIAILGTNGTMMRGS